jgi:hypothetical protein
MLHSSFFGAGTTSHRRPYRPFQDGSKGMPFMASSWSEVPSMQVRLTIDELGELDAALSLHEHFFRQFRGFIAIIIIVVEIAHCSDCLLHPIQGERLYAGALSF